MLAKKAKEEENKRNEAKKQKQKEIERQKLNNEWDGMQSTSLRKSMNVNIISEANGDGFGPSTEKKDERELVLRGREITIDAIKVDSLKRKHKRKEESPEVKKAKEEENKRNEAKKQKQKEIERQNLNNEWDGMQSTSPRKSLNVNIISEADDDGFGPSTEKNDERVVLRGK